MIPHTIHFVWIGPEMPDWAADNIRLFRELNTSFNVQVHGEDVLLPEFQAGYDAIKGEHVLSRKSDLLRVSVLLEHGGWYFDADFLPIRPLAALYEHYNCFPKCAYVTHGAYLRGRKWIANGIIGTTPGSPFMLTVYEGILGRIKRKECRWETFGPGLFTEIVEQRPDLVHVGLIDDWYRLQDRKQSMAAYVEIRKSGYSRESMERAIGLPLPFGMHMSMQDEVKL